MAVLRYIWNESTRFHTFVANRLALIREGSNVSDWMFVGTKDNPADDVSRGLNVDSLLESHRWIQGPQFLWNSQEHWPVQPMSQSLPVDDPEVRKSSDILVNLLSRFSSWTKLKKIVAWMLVAKECLKSWVLMRKSLQKTLFGEDPDHFDALADDRMKQIKMAAKAESKQKLSNTSLTVAMLDEAERIICQREQHRFFQEEINVLSSGSPDSQFLKKNSVIYKLDPIIMDGMLRVGGRLDRAAISDCAKHPIIIPAESPISSLILNSIHRSVGNLGRNSIQAEARQRFWIIRASYIIKKLLAKCVICRRYRAKCLGQKMADLPVDRTIAGEPPFTRVGMDFFGPIEVKRGCSTVKRYGVVFTCLSIRAIHLELACSLDTDSCINAIRRFVARRGPVKVIKSDKGTNLVGAERELRAELSR